MTTEKSTESLHKEIEGLRETLKQISYQNQMMLNWVNGAVITVDRDGHVSHANEAALHALGWELEDFIGLQCTNEFTIARMTVRNIPGSFVRYLQR